MYKGYMKCNACELELRPDEFKHHARFPNTCRTCVWDSFPELLPRAQRVAQMVRRRIIEELSAVGTGDVQSNMEALLPALQLAQGMRKTTVKRLHRKYPQTLNGKYSSYRHGAKARGLRFGLTRKKVTQLCSAPCHYCGTKGPGGIDRVDSSKDYVRGNVVPCCWICNRMKSNSDEKSWYEHMQKILDHRHRMDD